MPLGSLRSLKSLLRTNRSHMHISNYSRLFHLSSIRAPRSLYLSNLNSRFGLQSMKQNRSLFSYCVLPYSTGNTGLITINLREPKHKIILNCLQQAESRSVRPVISRRKVHTAQLSESGNPLMLERQRENELQERLILLGEKLLKAGIQLVSYMPGQYDHLMCPQCLGGRSQERSLSLKINIDGHSAVWKCFRYTCGLKRFVRPYSEVSIGNQALKVNGKVGKQKHPKKISEQELELEPLCTELFAYFKSRGISAETLRRNRVMQKPTKDGPAIAFTYQRDGTLISCKYRQIPKKFWQEAGTEKIFYGLDDIKNKHNIIIVEGEVDKLSMEEAGFKNCVSVPDGAPPCISNKEIPAEKEASRIILATDADGPGQALAEELARRLGKERCWRVKWPMKNDKEVFKDANEVLFCSGKEALREAVENAEMYPIRGLFKFNDFFQDIDKFYNGNVIDLGISTGWEGLDKYYKAYASKVTTETRASKVNAEVVKQPRKITEEELKLEPLCNELLLFFKTRGISEETLRRNRVMQKPTKRGTAIAFLYKRGGTLVNCKYRQLPKIFWQESGTEKILYGLDDVKNECDIIIVEGEIDKLSMEEAGFKNCVSVPNGAPFSISNKEVPAPQKDTSYQYLWTCMKYMKAASRIILATDADKPGQALAEELARRLGKERCWVVKWPMRTDDEVFKDANELLCYWGKEALREVIENAEMYPIGVRCNHNDSSQKID